jgi:hypothetical protein
MALGSPLVEPVPAPLSGAFWLGQAVGVGMAVGALIRPRFRGAALLAVLVAQVLLPTVLQIQYRRWTAPERYCHDSVLQFELALRDLREHRNPYARDYSDSVLARWKGWKDNPALHHFVYPPLLLLASLPLESAIRSVPAKVPPGVDRIADGPYDQRWVLLLCFAALIVLLWRQLREHPHRVGLLAVIVLNPWVAPFVVEGRNDAALLVAVAAAWIAYDRKRPLLGHVLLGTAVAAKTLLLPIVPFVVLAHRRDALRCAGLLIAPLALTSLPFLLWNAGAFVDDLVLAPAGHGSHPFEIRGWGGFGLANLVLALGLASSPQAAFPFLLFQIPLYGFVLWKASRVDLDRAGMFLWGTLGVFVVLWAGRFVHDNYLGTLLSIAAISQATRRMCGSTPGTPSVAR